MNVFFKVMCTVLVLALAVGSISSSLSDETLDQILEGTEEDMGSASSVKDREKYEIVEIAGESNYAIISNNAVNGSVNHIGGKTRRVVTDSIVLDNKVGDLQGTSSDIETQEIDANFFSDPCSFYYDSVINMGFELEVTYSDGSSERIKLYNGVEIDISVDEATAIVLFVSYIYSTGHYEMINARFEKYTIEHTPVTEVEIVGLNLCKPIVKTYNAYGFTVTKNDDGSVTVSGASNYAGTVLLDIGNSINAELKAGVRYSFITYKSDASLPSAKVKIDYTDGAGGYTWGWSTQDTSRQRRVSKVYLEKQCEIGDTSLNGTYKLMLNVGTTALPYTPYTGNVSRIEIPEEIISLPGYGMGINESCYNYLDIVNGEYVQRVDIVNGQLVELEKPVVFDVSELIPYDLYNISFSEPCTIDFITENGGAVPTVVRYRYKK